MTTEHEVPSRTTSQAMEEHIFDAELVDEADASRQKLWQRFMNWWMRSPRVPAALKSRQAAKHAVHAQVRVANNSSIAPTGTLQLVLLSSKTATTGKVVATKTLPAAAKGVVTIAYTPGRAGTFYYRVRYSGDRNGAASTSATRALRVT